MGPPLSGCGLFRQELLALVGPAAVLVPQLRAFIFGPDHEDILAADRPAPGFLEDFLARPTGDFNLVSIAASGVCEGGPHSCHDYRLSSSPSVVGQDLDRGRELEALCCDVDDDADGSEQRVAVEVAVTA